MSPEDRRTLIELELRELHPDLTRVLVVGNVVTIYRSGLPATRETFERGSRTRALIEELERLG